MSSRILLVEDEPGLQMTVADLLSADGHEVETASDGPTGLAKATSGSYDLVILDVMLPGKNGFDVCRDLRQMGSDVAILMLTARNHVVDRVVGLKLGADVYLAKPFDPQELLARVEALLRRVAKENLTPVVKYQFGPVQADFAKSEVSAARWQGRQPRGQRDATLAIPDRPSRQCADSRKHFISCVGVSAECPTFILTVRGMGYRFAP